MKDNILLGRVIMPSWNTDEDNKDLSFCFVFELRCADVQCEIQADLIMKWWKVFLVKVIKRKTCVMFV